MKFEIAFNQLLKFKEVDGLTFPILELVIFAADCYHIHSTFTPTGRLIDGHWDVGEKRCFKRGIARDRSVEPFEGVEDVELKEIERGSFQFVLDDLRDRVDDWRRGDYPYRFVWERATKEYLKVAKAPFIKGLFRELERERVICRNGRLQFHRRY